MNRTVIAFLLCLTLPALAGCTGYPPDAVRWGDTVMISYDATDLRTGEKLAIGQNATFVVGSGPLGFDVDHALVGRLAHDRFALESRGDAGRGLNEVRSVNQTLGPPIPATELALDRVAFTQALGEPSIGQKVALRNGPATVRDMNETLVFYLPDNQDVPQFGLRQAFNLRDDGMVLVTVETLPDRPLFQGPIGELLPDEGTYQALGVSEGKMHFAYSPSRTSALLGRDLAFDIIIQSVEHGTDPAGPSAGPGPQLQRDPRRVQTGLTGAAAAP